MPRSSTAAYCDRSEGPSKGRWDGLLHLSGYTGGLSWHLCDHSPANCPSSRPFRLGSLWHNFLMWMARRTKMETHAEQQRTRSTITTTKKSRVRDLQMSIWRCLRIYLEQDAVKLLQKENKSSFTYLSWKRWWCQRGWSGGVSKRATSKAYLAHPLLRCRAGCPRIPPDVSVSTSCKLLKKKMSS